MYFNFFWKYSPGRHKYGRGFAFKYKIHTFIFGVKFIINRKKLFPQPKITWIYRNTDKEKLYKDYKVYAWCKPSSLPLLLEKGFKKGETCIYVEKIIEDIKPPFEQCFVSC